jgi:hypothetical protein
VGVGCSPQAKTRALVSPASNNARDKHTWCRFQILFTLGGFNGINGDISPYEFNATHFITIDVGVSQFFRVIVLRNQQYKIAHLY